MTYQDTILATTGLTSYWPLNGDAVDAQGANDGLVMSATFVTGGIPVEVSASVAHFDATNEHIRVPDHNDIDLGNVFSVEVWFKRSNTTATSQYLWSKLAASGVNPPGLTILNGKASFQQPNVGVIITSLADVNIADVWYYVAVTKNGTAQNDTNIYVNGEASNGSRNARTLGDSTSSLYIGQFNATTQPFGGDIAHLAMYKGTVLTPEIIASHYAEGAALPSSGITLPVLRLGANRIGPLRVG